MVLVVNKFLKKIFDRRHKLLLKRCRQNQGNRKIPVDETVVLKSHKCKAESSHESDDFKEGKGSLSAITRSDCRRDYGLQGRRGLKHQTKEVEPPSGFSRKMGSQWRLSFFDAAPRSTGK